MKLKELGLTAQDIKDKVSKYMIETYERFDFLAETARDQYIYDENGTPYLDFYAGIAVNSAGNCNDKVVAAVKDQVGDIMHTFNYPYTIPQALLVGVEFDDTISGVDVKHGCLDRHLLLTAIGAHTIRMIPPLIITEADCDKAVEIILEAVLALEA